MAQPHPLHFNLPQHFTSCANFMGMEGINSTQSIKRR